MSGQTVDITDNLDSLLTYGSLYPARQGKRRYRRSTTEDRMTRQIHWMLNRQRRLSRQTRLQEADQKIPVQEVTECLQQIMKPKKLTTFL